MSKVRAEIYSFVEFMQDEDQTRSSAARFFLLFFQIVIRPKGKARVGAGTHLTIWARSSMKTLRP